MATLELQVPLKTRDALVDAPADLPVGRYRVILVASGRTATSAPATLLLNVVRRRALSPTPPDPTP